MIPYFQTKTEDPFPIGLLHRVLRKKKQIRLASGQPWTRRGPEMPSSSLHGLQMGVLKTGDPKVTMVISSLEWSMTWMIWGILGAPP